MVLSRDCGGAIVRPACRACREAACRTSHSVTAIAVHRFSLTLLLFSSLAAGCGKLSIAPNQQAAQAAMQQQVQTLSQQNQEYQSRASSLDRDNQELESLLAQSRQQIQLLNDELGATRQQLQSTTDQLLAMRADNEQLRTKSTQLVATAQQRAGAEIHANNTLLKNLAVKQMPGIEVRQDGDVVRVEAPADKIFMPGSNYLQNGAEQLLASIAAEFSRSHHRHRRAHRRRAYALAAIPHEPPSVGRSGPGRLQLAGAEGDDGRQPALRDWPRRQSPGRVQCQRGGKGSEPAAGVCRVSGAHGFALNRRWLGRIAASEPCPALGCLESGAICTGEPLARGSRPRRQKPSSANDCDY
jgi:flagellar motor protein MotB